MAGARDDDESSLPTLAGPQPIRIGSPAVRLPAGDSPSLITPLPSGPLLGSADGTFSGRDIASATASSDGELLGGRFRVLALLGSGGMGNVYKAHDTELDEQVALKMLKPGIAPDARWLEQFHQEVRLARRVTHPNVARTFDIGEHGGEKFLTMEFVDGESLAQVLRREGPLTATRALELCLPVCAGLSAAHRAGVVHRDLKPDNVLCERGGRVVITDFGVARATDAPAQPGGGGPPVGTPAYMAPEQVSGGPLDGRTDLFALGVILFEMLTGTRPWSGPTPVALAVARLLMPPPDPRKLNPDLDEPLAAAVLKLLARQPAERPTCADDARRLLASLHPTRAEALARPDPSAAACAPGTRPERNPPAPTAAQAPVTPLVQLASPDEASGRDPGVAVLPFRNAGQADDEHWADGFTDDLIETLSLVPRLRVQSRGAVMRFKGHGRDPRDVGQELGVHVVVEGSVRRQQGTLRIQVRAVSVADGFQLFARRFDRTDTDLLTIADEAAQAIADGLLKQLGAPHREPIRDPEALDLYLRARQEHHSFSYDGAHRAAELLAAGLGRCPDDARLLAAHSLACARMWLLGTDNDGAAHAAALRSAERAKQLAPQLGEPHLAMASIRMQEVLISEGIDELLAALVRGPLLAEVHEQLGRLLLETGALDEGMAALERACSLEPGLTSPRRELARAHALRGDLPAAFRMLDEIEAAGNQGAVAVRARLLVWAGRWQEGKALLAQSANPTVQTLHGVVFGGLPFEELVPGLIGPRRGRRALYYQQLRCEVLAVSGETGAALEVLVQADAGGLFDQSWLALCPALHSLHDQPRFTRVRERVDRRASELLARLSTARPRS